MLEGLSKILPGGDLLSHAPTRAVPSAQRGLTAVFGMGTGVSPSPQPPEKANWERTISWFNWNRGRAIGFAVDESEESLVKPNDRLVQVS